MNSLHFGAVIVTLAANALRSKRCLTPEGLITFSPISILKLIFCCVIIGKYSVVYITCHQIYRKVQCSLHVGRYYLNSGKHPH